MFGASAGSTRIDPRELGALAALLTLAAWLLGRQLGSPSLEFDEGVYLLSTDLLGRGLELGRDVFSSQPPLFLALLDGANHLANGSFAALRAVTVGIALAGALAGWAIVRGIAGPFPALAAAALVVLAPGVVDAAAVVSADVPCVALGTGALLAARAARQRPVWAAVAGTLLACALLVKLLAVPFAVALAVAAIVDRPSRRALGWFAVGTLAVLGAAALAYASVLGELWRSAIGLHLEAREGTISLPRSSIVAEVAMIVTAYVGMLALLAVGLAHRPRSELRTWARDRADLLTVLAAALLLVAFHRPLLHHHLVIVAWPLALIAASTLPARLPPRALVVTGACALLVVPWAARGRDTVEGAESARLDRVAAAVEASTAPGETVVSDLPLVPLFAERPAAPATVDPSAVRVGTGSLGRDDILAAADEAGAAVVGRSFELVPGLEAGLASRYATVVDVGGVRIYAGPREPASPGGSRVPAS
ncbi:MAG TPA: glycosyltransferase family 39 protein [Solirubrobacterales bacterium]|jgi:hypothetical protein|nr:glycosyltransferase family 39 protein [Solirubrobacterales bacterium]